MKGGFTLLESVIVMSLLGVVGLGFAYLFTTAQRFMIQSLNSTSSQGDAAFALEHIKRHLTVATDITVPVTVPVGNQLKFTWQEIVVGVVTDRTSRYEITGTDLRYFRDANAGTFEVVARGIQTGGTPPLPPLFTRATAGTISVNITARKTTGGDSRDMRLQTTISPRGLF